MSGARLVVAESINSVPRDDWEALTVSDVHGQFGWLQALETGATGTQSPKYFLLYRDDHLIAAAVGYCYSHQIGQGRPGELLFGRMASLASNLRLTPGKCLYLGPIIGHGRPILWHRNCGAAEAVERIQLLLEAITVCDEFSGSTFVFGRIPDEETHLIAALRGLGYLESRSWPISYLDVNWKSFEDYVGSLSRSGKNVPNKVRREVAAPQKQCVRIEELDDFESHALEIYRLFEETHGKHTDSRMEFGPQFVKALADVHSRGCVISVARSEENKELLGAALLLVAKDTAAGWLMGVADAPLNRKAFTYFNLAYYAPMRYCITNNIRRIYFGGGLRRAKRKRGCKEMGVSILLRPSGRFAGLLWRAWFIVHRIWVRRKILKDTS